MPKHKGSCVDYADQRDAFLKYVYRKMIAKCRYIRVKEIMALIVKEPAPRYWISEQRATSIVKQYIKGIKPPENHSPKLHKRLYDSLYQRYLQERAKRPDDTIYMIMFDVVNSPAPESFITPQSAEILLSRYRKRLAKRASNNQSQQCNVKDDLDSDSGNDDCSICSDTASAGFVDGLVQSGSDIQSLNISDVSCFDTSSGNQFLLSPFADLPVRSIRIEGVDIVRDSMARSKLYNRRYTNVRYIRSQLRIDWDAD